MEQFSIVSKMKTIAVLLVALAVNVSGFLIKFPTKPPMTKPVNSGWVHLQGLILPLFENVCELSPDLTIQRLAKEFTMDSTSGDYQKPDVAANLQDYLVNGKGLLRNNEVFSEYNPDHLHELKLIFELLFYANDFDTFFRAASWARQNVNCGLFVDVIYLAMLHRRDMAHLAIPPPYEVLPNYFIPKSFIDRASVLLSGEIPIDLAIRSEGNSYIVDANYTSDFNGHDESSLAYFREDIGLNSYYFFQRLKMCSWLQQNSDLNNRHGEHLYFQMRQLTARYNLEKHSHGLTDFDDLNWNTFVLPDYNPMLIYSNGEEFENRAAPIDLSGDQNVKLLQSINNNVASVVQHLIEIGYNKTQILNHVMDIMISSDKSFDVLARKTVSDATATSMNFALNHYLTSVRDIAFWKLNKLATQMIENALTAMPPYEKRELFFPGLELVSMDVKPLQTYFDYFQVDVTDALKSNENVTFQVKINQPRLNHKPFSLKLNVTSLKVQKGLIKIFLGPKTLPGQLIANKHMFMLLDSYECDFKKGTNVVSRSSVDMKYLAPDMISLASLRKNIAVAEYGLADALPPIPIHSLIGFPSRLIIPKGTEEGLPLQIFAIVVPFVKLNPTSKMDEYMPNMEFNDVVLSPGFPFDLPISDSQIFNLPNALIKDVNVTHKEISKDKTVPAKKWKNPSTTEQDYPVEMDKSNVYLRPYEYQFNKPMDLDRPNIQLQKLTLNQNESFDYQSRKKGSFDYQSKKGQFGRKNDYNYVVNRKPNYAKYQKTTVKVDPVNKIISTTNIPVIRTEEDLVEDVSFTNDENKFDFSEIITPIYTYTYDFTNQEMSNDADSRQTEVDAKESTSKSFVDYNVIVPEAKQKPSVEKKYEKVRPQIKYNKYKKSTEEPWLPTVKSTESTTTETNEIDKYITIHKKNNNTDTVIINSEFKYPIHKEPVVDIASVVDDEMTSKVKQDNLKYPMDNKIPKTLMTVYNGMSYNDTVPVERKTLFDYLLHPYYADDYFDEEHFNNKKRKVTK